MSTPQPISSALPANQRVIKLLVRQDARDAQRIDWLCEHIARNRFLPAPPS
jgi:hypothetical protein